MSVFLALLVFFQVGGSFVDPAVEGRETTASRMEIDLSVSAAPGGSVVVHTIEPGGRQETFALRERSPGRYGGIFEVGRVDLVVVFEALDGVGTQSAPMRLTDIGLDRALLGALPVAPTTAPATSSETRGWGWLALAMGAGSLALLALWALPDKREPEEAEPGESVDQAEPDESADQDDHAP
jgi:hypothetical protein